MRALFTNAAALNVPRSTQATVASGSFSATASQNALVLLSLPMLLTADFATNVPGAGMDVTVTITIGTQSWTVAMRRISEVDPDKFINPMGEPFHWSRLVYGLSGATAVSVALAMGADTQATVAAGDCQLIVDVESSP